MDQIDSRQKILDAALKEFAEKGYEGARVEEIAKTAGVSKALIYYIFEGKAAILSELLDQFRNDLVGHLSATYREDECGAKWKRLDHDEIQASLDFMHRNRLQYKILMMESLISNAGKARVLTLWDEVNTEVRTSILAKRGYQLDPADVQRHLVDFFFINVPTIFYSLFGAEWIELNQYDLTEVNEKLGQILHDLYNRYMN
jgi:AcrR family transcriptional regulator